ncbi:hypothetical protein BuS5_00373 [Desulfosarcina sp. BuS5]|uniref:response regulator n=1 Tax=Desulfosarcina sp. BuS5 TaxID=933262 RepID=UPI000688BE72|nr:response regulator [Desulfosarcina sp. BuS5]WDN87405.1 hypothetical protein BuS5_00373 [Desulfosarcina sp. BuS5]
MHDKKHTILCVDDEKNILNSLKRLLRKEAYHLVTASGGEEGLHKLAAEEISLVVSDHRMPGMSGTEFLQKVKNQYPDIIRIILTGYTEVDSITESINRGHIYKFLLKPWNDQNLILEIRQALDQYDLVKANKKLHDEVIQKNAELKRINENLEMLVRERTRDLEVQNHALELSRTILEDLTLPVIGISDEGMIALLNRSARSFNGRLKGLSIGSNIECFFPDDLMEMIKKALPSETYKGIKGYGSSDNKYDIDFIPLSGLFKGKGIIMIFRDICL